MGQNNAAVIPQNIISEDIIMNDKQNQQNQKQQKTQDSKDSQNKNQNNR